MWFNKKDPEEFYPPKDEYQRKYRQAFEGIVDKYLIYHCEDENAKILIYIDLDNDIDWIMKKDPLDGNEELNQERNKWLANLDIAQASPCLNLSEKNIMKFKIMLGAGYESALYGNFDSVQSCIDQALLFLKARNKEQSRYIILSVSTTIVIMSLIAGCICNLFSDEQIVGLELGVLGSYVSIWSRFGKMNLTGLASKKIHYLEAFARLFCGGIFAFVAILFIDTGLVLKDITVSNLWAYHCIVGFIAGFNERFVPSIIESFTSNTTEEKK